MKEYNENEFLMLSGIQHFVFCRRQWALIHIEQQWAENVRTIQGMQVHERVHNDVLSEKRKDIITSRGMPVFSRTLGVNGVCDVVEFHKSKKGTLLNGYDGLYIPVPVEYKRGKPKSSDADILQLCAQAMCLEEMLLCEINYGYMYYNEIRHRLKVEFNIELKDKVRKIFLEMHQMFERSYTPKVKTSKACNLCSLKDICLPKLCKNTSVKSYIKKFIEDDSIEKTT